jgi:hypothetical protein
MVEYNLYVGAKSVEIAEMFLIDMHYWASTIFKNKYHTKIFIIYFILSGYYFHRRKIDASDLPKGGLNEY